MVTEHETRSLAFPVLSDEQVAALASCTHAARKTYRDGEILVDVGDREFAFHVVLRGEIEILDVSGDEPISLTVHRRGQFTGDVSHLTGNPSVVRAVARGECEVLAIATATLREALNACPDFGDVVLQAFLLRRELIRDSGRFTGLRVLGSRYSHDTFRIREFLARNRVLFTWIDLETAPEVDRLLEVLGIGVTDTPVVACGKKLLLRNPTNRELAESIGIRRHPDRVVHDLVVVGAGPAGLAAAVYGASEGLRTVVLERAGPGGQAGASMRIENYLGFPMGITGAELIDRAVLQANKFGAVLSVAAPVARLGFDNQYAVLKLEDEEEIVSRCLLIATGAEYRRLPVTDCERFEGCGVYYAATPNELIVHDGEDALVVGGGNSAGQAAVFLASRLRRVFLVVRGNDLGKNMSSYLVHRIESTENVELLRNTEVEAMRGSEQLAAVELVDRRSGARRTIETQALFSFIGAVPRTAWLPPEIDTDERGFVLTGNGLTRAPSGPATREPYLLETSRQGVFAAGDVRAGSVKRVASAVGEGAMAVQFVHAVLGES